jgi:hypothetical protein
MTCRRAEHIMQRVGRLCHAGKKGLTVPTIATLKIALALIMAAAAVSPATAQGRPSVTMSLFGAAPVDAPKAEILGMRPETVGAVAYFSLSVDAANSLRGRSDTPQRMEIALPGGGSVTCTFRSERRPGGMLLLTGTPVNGAPGERCNLVVDNGRVTGEVDIAAGRYRIQPLGSGPTHAVVEVKTEAFPNEREPKRAPRTPGERRG